MTILDENSTEFQKSESSCAMGIYNNIHMTLVGSNCLGHVIGHDSVWA